MPADRDYPATVAEVLDPGMKFDRAALAAARAFAAARPYRQAAAPREQSVRALCEALSAAYGIRAVRPDSLQGIEAALREAFTAKGPTLIEVREDARFLA